MRIMDVITFSVTSYKFTNTTDVKEKVHTKLTAPSLLSNCERRRSQMLYEWLADGDSS